MVKVYCIMGMHCYYLKYYEFKTRAEASAFKKGVKAGMGWGDAKAYSSKRCAHRKVKELDIKDKFKKGE